MKNIAVIIRVYSRVEDTKELVHIIKDKWKLNNYSLFIVHNGANDGYLLDEELANYADILEVTTNSGHRTGARDLVKGGYNYIKKREDFDYVLFIESDFWIFDDKLIQAAIQSDKDLATTIWIEKRKSLGVDFFLVKKPFIDEHSSILDWDKSPETDMRDNFNKTNGKLHIFKELRPIHAPSLMRKTFKNLFSPTHYEGGRFRIFIKAKTVSHHIEDLTNGMNDKKSIANAMLGYDYFKNSAKYTLTFLDKYAQKIAAYFPQASWYK